MKLDTFSFQQAMPFTHGAYEVADKAWSTDPRRQRPSDAFMTGATRILSPVVCVKSAVTEAAALPVRALVGTSVRRQLAGRTPEAENFMHRGLLGAVADGIRAGAPKAAGEAGAGMATLVGLVKRDPSGARQQAWRDGAAKAGTWVGKFLQGAIEGACAAVNGVLLGLTVGFSLALQPITLVVGVGVGTFYAFGQAFAPPANANPAGPGRSRPRHSFEPTPAYG